VFLNGIKILSSVVILYFHINKRVNKYYYILYTIFNWRLLTACCLTLKLC